MPDSTPAPTVAICCAANSPYVPLLQDMVNSLLLAKTAVSFDLFVLDLGLEDADKDWLIARGATIAPAAWDIDFPGREEQPLHFRSQTARAFLPRYFPGYETYIWLDADVWLQDGQVLDWLVKGAASGAMALIEEHHSAYNKVHDQPEMLKKARLIHAFYGEADANTYGFTPSLNSGVFALRADAPHWAIWAAEMEKSLHHKVTTFVDQLALERTIHAHKLPATYLPARANWVINEARPAYCPDRGKLVDPLPPHDPLWVIHLALGSKDMTFEIPMLDGRYLDKKLRFSDMGPLVGLFPKDP